MDLARVLAIANAANAHCQPTRSCANLRLMRTKRKVVQLEAELDSATKEQRAQYDDGNVQWWWRVWIPDIDGAWRVLFVDSWPQGPGYICASLSCHTPSYHMLTRLLEIARNQALKVDPGILADANSALHATPCKAASASGERSAKRQRC